MQGKLIIISAPSGAGKTSIVKELICADLNLEFSVSACSREKRKGEVDGKDYYFMRSEEFREKIRNEEFVEWEEVYKDHFYGTLKREVEKIREAGKNVIFDVDVVGGLNIKKLYGQEALAIFIMPPSEKVLWERLQKRNTEDADKLNMRISKARQELKEAKKFDVSIVNDDLATAIEETKEAVRKFLNQQ